MRHLHRRPAAGESTTVTIPLTIDAGAPRLTVKVTVDPTDAIVETDETNNASRRTPPSSGLLHTLHRPRGRSGHRQTQPGRNDTDVTYSFVVTNVGDLSTESWAI